MASYDERARAAAARALAPIAQGGKGQAVTITTSTPGTFDPATSIVPVTDVVQTGSGVEEAYSSRSVDGTLILVGDKKFLLSPLNSVGGVLTAPKPDKSVLTLADGSRWTVKRVDPLAPAGLATMFTLQLRGAA